MRWSFDGRWMTLGTEKTLVKCTEPQDLTSVA